MSAHAKVRVPAGEPGAVYEQYETLEQQNESYILGMWTFLVTEIMFFGALFVTYALYRWKYQPIWYELHKDLNVAMGATNTTILLASSFSVALAVYFAQRGKNRPNRLGLCTCRIVRVEGLALEVEGLDAIDGTPVLDIKPAMRGFLLREAVREPQWAAEIMAGYW